MSQDKWNKAFMAYFGNRKRKLKGSARTLKKMIHIDRLDKSSRILELFCGRGELLEVLAGWEFNNIFGLDISKELFENSKLKSRIVVGNSVNLSFKSDCFDAVIINEGLHHLNCFSDIDAQLKEIGRVLMNRSLFVFCEPRNSLFRKIGFRLVFSPLSKLFKRIEACRLIFEEEMQTYTNWINNENKIYSLLIKNGFVIKNIRKSPLHIFVECTLNK
ncbi:MAG: class I SAM-dependent methyltransferase [Candidatus Omnitrophota bacterium]|nr:MAG: class I SAM-dependent methyltransferase [Candidatus Omnitrophota bacterium]